MENRDPYDLIRAAAAGLRRRHVLNLVLPWLPAGAVLAGFAAVARLPVELAAAAAVLAAALLLHASAPPPPLRRAASRLDERSGGRDHFLTLATAELEPPMRDLVESGAARLGQGLRAADVLPPLAGRRVGWGAAGAALLALLLWLAPAEFPQALDPAQHLEEIAAGLEETGELADVALARELRAVAAALRDPSASAQERQEAAQRALENLEQQEKGSGTEGGGGEQGDAGASGSEELRGEARSALERASESTGGQESGTGESSGESSGETEGPGETEGSQTGEQAGESGGGVKAPRPDASGAREREQESEGQENRPDDSPAKSLGSKGGAGEGREPRDPNRPGPGEAKGPDPSGGAGGEGTAPSPSTAEGPENPDLPGAGTGWRIVDGRYVRVRVPEGENEALETERVRGPGEVEPTTPWSNAPLPGEGPTGEPVERQPLPLEYRNVLREKKTR